MKTLKDAIRQLLLQSPQMAIPKEGYEINDYISIFDFIKDKKRIRPKDQLHINKLINDKTILKRYWSTDMPEHLQYLVLMLLGLEWLLYTGNFDDAQKAKGILKKKIGEELQNMF